MNDGRVAMPPDEYLKTDHRLPMKDGGRYICTPDAQTGAHGDTFDSGKLAEFALMGRGSGVAVAVEMRPNERAGRQRMSRQIGGML